MKVIWTRKLCSSWKRQKIFRRHYDHQLCQSTFRSAISRQYIFLCAPFRLPQPINSISSNSHSQHLEDLYLSPPPGKTVVQCHCIRCSDRFSGILGIHAGQCIHAIGRRVEVERNVHYHDDRLRRLNVRERMVCSNPRWLLEFHLGLICFSKQFRSFK